MRFYIIFLAAICSTTLVQAQIKTVTYTSTEYFTGLDFADSLLIKTNMVITIAQNKVEFMEVDPEDSTKNKPLFSGRCLSPIEYSTRNGNPYTVWKLGDRKMVSREQDGTMYISLYQTNDFGLPKEYLTFKIDN
jgi:hypothetical protein